MSTNRNQPRNERPLSFFDRIGRKGKLTIATISTLALAACGIGGGDKDAPRPTVTVTADQSPNPNTTPDVTLAPTSVVEIPSTSSEAPTSSSETEAPGEQKLYVENPDGTVSFPVEAYKDKPEQLVRDFVEVGFQSWVDAGSDLETLGEKDYSEQELAALSASYTKPFEESLFVSGGNYLNSPAVEDLAQANHYQMVGYYVSEGLIEVSSVGPLDKLYALKYSIDSAGGDIVIISTGDNYVNATAPLRLSDNYSESAASLNKGVKAIDKTTVVRLNLVSTPEGNYKIGELTQAR